MSANLESRGYAALRRAILEHLPVDAVNDGPAERLLRRAADSLQVAEARENICSFDHGSPSLRDRFAMAALVVWSNDSAHEAIAQEKGEAEEVIARAVYVVADAMIEERKRER